MKPFKATFLKLRFYSISSTCLTRRALRRLAISFSAGKIVTRLSAQGGRICPRMITRIMKFPASHIIVLDVDPRFNNNIIIN